MRAIRGALPSNKNYAYTLSMTIYADGSQCTNPRRRKGSDGKFCLLFGISRRFLLYFHGKNQARIVFYLANKKYQSPLFFVPINQWVTIQLSVKYLGGYTVTL